MGSRRQYSTTPSSAYLSGFTYKSTSSVLGDAISSAKHGAAPASHTRKVLSVSCAAASTPNATATSGATTTLGSPFL